MSGDATDPAWLGELETSATVNSIRAPGHVTVHGRPHLAAPCLQEISNIRLQTRHLDYSQSAPDRDELAREAVEKREDYQQIIPRRHLQEASRSSLPRRTTGGRL